MGDPGAGALATAIRSPHCRRNSLDLRGRQITAVSARFLAEALANNVGHQPTEFDLRDNPVTAAAQAELQAAAPRCNFRF